MKTSWNPLMFAGAVAVLTLGLVFGGVVPTSAQPDKKGDPGALRPFQKQLCTANVFSCPDPVHSFDAPVVTSDGEPVLRLVIEYVSGGCDMGIGGVNSGVVLQTVANGTTVTHSFVPVAAVGPIATRAFAQATRLYADPGTQLVFGASVNFTATSSCKMTLSGHLAVD
jgi:hypothetical protein